MRGLRMICLALPVVVIGASALMLAALGAEPSFLSHYAPDLAAGDDRRAEQAMTLQRPGFANAVRSYSEAALRQAPYDNGALLRIAYLDWKTNGRLSVAGLDAFARSYRRVPFDRSVSLWRIRFALENWDVLPLELREQVRREVFVVATEPGHMWPLRIRLTGVTNAQGRIVASIWDARIAQMM